MATEVISTIRSSGGDYTSLTSWEAGEQADLVAADEIAVAECYNDWPAGLLEPIITVTGWVTSAACYPKIYTPASERHTGVLKDAGGDYTGFTVKFDKTVNDLSYNAANGYIQTDGIAFDKDNYNYHAIQLGGGDQLFTNNLIAGNHSGRRAIFLFYARNSTLHGNIIIGGEDGFSYGKYTSNTSFINNTIIGCSDYGVLWDCYSSPGGVLKNNLVSGCGLSDYLFLNTTRTPPTCDYNASSDDSADDLATGSNNRVNQTFTFEDATNGDYHLSAADAGAKGFGENLYSEFTHDIDGDEWPSAGVWDIGADYYSAGGGGDQTITITDSASITDTIAQILAGITMSDHGVGNDSPSLGAALAVLESGTGNDLLTLSVNVPVSDAGTGDDSTLQLSVSVPVTDAGTGTDALSVLAEGIKLVTDSGIGTDALAAIDVHASISDNATGTDALAAIDVHASISDNATGTDAIAAPQAVVTITDLGAGTDALSLITETLKTIIDSGTGLDAIASVAVALPPVTDNATGTDQVGAQVQLTLADSGTGTDALSILQQAIKLITDSGIASDVLGVTVSVPLTENAIGSDSVNTLHSIIQIIDSAGGTDAVVSFDTAVEIVSIAFKLSGRTINFKLH